MSAWTPPAAHFHGGARRRHQRGAPQIAIIVGTVDVDALYGQGGGGVRAIGGLPTNTGASNIGAPHVDQGAPTTVAVKSLSNFGTIKLIVKGPTILSSFVVLSAAGFGALGSPTGSVNPYNDVSIIFDSGEISDIAANRRLTLANADSVVADAGGTSSNSALTALATIEGRPTLFDGSFIVTTAGAGI